LLQVVLEKCLDLDASAAVVIDRNGIPTGTIFLREIVALSEDELNSCTAKEYASAQVATVAGNELVLNLAEVFRQTCLPILAIVDDKGKLIGTIREREIIRKLASVQETYLLDKAK
jgi:predicted transcriptional regulator